MRETSKSQKLREARGDFRTFLRGDGIDIGAGTDPLRAPHASVRSWDKEHGDGGKLSEIPDESFDFVYSSHTLEHMKSIEEAVSNWIRVLKPGGFLYIVVPEYVLYEKMTWPSIYSEVHTHSFSSLITRAMVRRNDHYHIDMDLEPLLRTHGVTLLRKTLEDEGFDYNAGARDQTLDGALCQICIVGQKTDRTAPSHAAN